MECCICLETLARHKNISFGCCSAVMCRGCAIRSHKCPLCRAIPYWVVEWAKHADSLLLAVQCEKDRHANAQTRLKKNKIYIKTLKDEIQILKKKAK